MSIDVLLQAWPIFLIATTIGLSLSFGLVASLHIGSRLKFEWMWVFFIGVLVSLAAGVLIQGRQLLSSGDEAMATANLPELSDFVASNWVSRSITLICLAIATERIVRFVVRREFQSAAGYPLLLSLMFFILAVNGLAAAFGTSPQFTHHYLYAPIILLGLFAFAQNGVKRLIYWLRAALLAFLLCAWIIFPFDPLAVAQTGYAGGLMPGFNVRFFGFATHANTLAPLCFVLLTCLFLQPFGSRAFNAFAWTVGVLSLFATQSKTSVVLVVLAIAWLFFYRRLRAGDAAGARSNAWFVLASVGGLLLLIGTMIVLTLLAGLLDPRVGRRLAFIFEQQQLLSLTGRTRIWSVTTDALAENPFFGYGPTLWGPEFRVKTGLFFTHAHNQYIQTLGSAGAVGLMSLFVFLGVLMITAWRTRVVTQGVSVALTIYLILRGVTEVPLSMANPFQGEFVVLMFLFVLIVGSQKLLDGSESSTQPRRGRGSIRGSVQYTAPAT